MSQIWEVAFVYANAVFNFIAIIVGASIGGLITLHAAQKGFDQSLNRDKNQRIHEEKARAISLTLKLTEIMERYSTYLSILRENRSRAPSNPNVSIEPWMYNEPFIGNSRQAPHFTSKELAVLVSSGQTNLVTDCTVASERFLALKEAVDHYSKRRLELTDRLPVYIHSDDVSASINGEAFLENRSRMIELNSLLEQIETLSSSNLEEAESLAQSLGSTFRDYFDDPTFIVARIRGTNVSEG